MLEKSWKYLLLLLQFIEFRHIIRSIFFSKSLFQQQKNVFKVWVQKRSNRFYLTSITNHHLYEFPHCKAQIPTTSTFFFPFVLKSLFSLEKILSHFSSATQFLFLLSPTLWTSSAKSWSILFQPLFDQHCLNKISDITYDKMKLLLLLACLIGTVYSVSFYDIVIEEWESWKLFHRKLC